MSEQVYNFQKKPTSVSRKNLLSTILISIILLLAMTVLAGFIGFGKKGFDIQGNLQQFWFYAAFGVGSLVGILLLEFYFHLKKRDSGESTFFNNPRFKFLQNPLKLILLSLIVFTLLGLVTQIFGLNTFNLGIGTLKEQFTPADGILFNWVLVVTSENLGAAFFAGVMVLLLSLAADKWKFKGNNFKYLAIMLFIISFIIYGFVLHQLRYSQSEPDLFRVIIFWAIGGVLSALTGSIIPFLAAHGMNNTFVELIQAYSKEASIIPIIIFLIIIIALFALFYLRRKKKKNE